MKRTWAYLMIFVILFISFFKIFNDPVEAENRIFFNGNRLEKAVDEKQTSERIRRVENNLLTPVVIKGRNNGMSLPERMKFYNVPGVSIAVINDGKIEWAKGYGVKRAGGGDPVTIETLFQAASISKPVTAIAVLKLVESGKLRLDEDINLQLKSWKIPENEFTKDTKVTLRHLLSHTAGTTVSGFPGYEKNKPLPSTLQILNGEPPASNPPILVRTTPGTGFRYSGGGYTILQQLLTDVEKKTFPVLMNDLVLKKLGMKSSTFEQKPPANLENKAASAHDPIGSVISGDWHLYPQMAAAGLWSTPSDLAALAIEIQKSNIGKSNKILLKETVNQMLTPQVGGMGLGFELQGEGQQARFLHTGRNDGYTCLLLSYQNTGRGAVIMTNSDRGGPLIDEIVRSIAKEYGWLDYKPVEKVLGKISPQIYKDLIGQYESDPETTMNVTLENGKLMIQGKFRPKVELFPESETEFFVLDSALQYVFVRDETGKVKNLTLRRNGQDNVFRKVR